MKKEGSSDPWEKRKRREGREVGYEDVQFYILYIACN